MKMATPMDTTHYSTPFAIDGQPVRLLVSRLTVAEALAFDRNYRMLERIYQRNALDLRQWRTQYDAAFPEDGPEVDWQTPPDVKDPNFEVFAKQLAARERWNVARSDDTIAYRDLHETDADREAREAREARDDAWANTFLTEALTKYITFEAGQLLNGEPVSTGADLLRMFGARIGVLFDLISAIRVQNVWTDDAKKKWALRFGFVPSLAPSTQTASGDAPATTAAPVSASVPASDAPVTV